ncbi:MAG: hypothetical protein FJW90_09830 [Actinobacteria bacterium]|nr:hypothetical protein [Actinomycetota bacterium]
MERAAWTDERLDDLADSIRNGFARLDQDMRDMRGEVSSLRAEMQQEFSSLRAVLFSFGGGIILALIGVIAAILARGA